VSTLLELRGTDEARDEAEGVRARSLGAPPLAKGHALRETIRKRDAAFRRAVALADMWSVGSVLALTAMVLGDDRLKLAALAVPIAFVVVAKAMGLYDRDEHLLHKSTLDEVPALFAFATLAVLLLWLADGLLIDGELDRAQVLGAWIGLFMSLALWRTLARAIARLLTPPERCLLVGDAASGMYLVHRLKITPAVKAELVGVVSADPAPEVPGVVDLPQELGETIEAQGVERVVLATGETNGGDELLHTIRELKAYGVKVSVMPEASRVAGTSTELDHLHGITLLGMRRFEFTRSSRLFKRSFDVAGASLALTVLSPLLLAIAIAIRLDTKGPILFRQRRVGRHGEQFQMLKFRSMVDDAEQLKSGLAHMNEGAEGLFKIASDPRVTRVGQVMRGWQLDELPQLWNVLKGEMSLVGPRPLIPEEDQQIEGRYRRRLDVPPGITGYWQILGSSAYVSIDEMVKLDELYVANWSLWGDVVLLLRTVPFLARRGGL
jgi:exopolysaccharide biosynthesis polyprenyl glycosylphosphotransferase